MQLRRQDNVAYAAIANATTAAPAAGAKATNVTIKGGQVALVDEGNIILDAAAYTALPSDARVRIIQNVGGSVLGGDGELVASATLTKSKIRLGKSDKAGAPTASATGSISVFSAAQQQITRIGFNGTTGALPTTTVETNFFIKLRKNDNDAANRSQPNSLFAQFRTDVTGSQEELALGLVKNGILNMSTQPEGNNGYVRFEAINAAAGTAITGPANFTVENGSKTVAISAAVTGATLVVGSLIRFGTAVTDPVYKVADLTATTITLGHAYQGVTGIILLANVEAILAGAPFGNQFGIQMTGVVSDFDVDAFRNYYSNRFTATFSDTSTLNTHVQGAKDGTGMWQQAAMDEYMSMGNQGENSMLGVPPRKRSASVEKNAQYDILRLTADEDIFGLTSSNTESGSVLLFLKGGAAALSGLEVAKALGYAAGDLT